MRRELQWHVIPEIGIKHRNSSRRDDSSHLTASENEKVHSLPISLFISARSGRPVSLSLSQEQGTMASWEQDGVELIRDECILNRSF